MNGQARYVTSYQFTVDRLALGEAVNCGVPGGAVTPLAPRSFGFATSGSVSHSFFLPFAATYDFSSMRLFLHGSTSSCSTGT